MWGGNVQGVIVGTFMLILAIAIAITYYFREDEISDEDFMSIALEEMDHPDFK
jgi:hypothetical protein